MVVKRKATCCKTRWNQKCYYSKDNEPDLQEIPKQITKSLNIIPVEWIDEVISSALVDEPTPISKKIRQQKNKTPRKAINEPAH